MSLSGANSISVVIPVFNGAAYIQRAIESVRLQSLPVSEVIVIDDGSEDNTGEVVRAIEDVIYIRQENHGAGAARNRGIAMATGDWIAFLDADDLWTPEKLRLQMNAIQNNSELEVVCGHVRQFVSTDQAANPADFAEDPLPTYLPSCTMVRRSTFAKIGLLNKDLRIGDFIDWLCRAVEAGTRMVVLPETLAYRRLHGDNLGIRRRDARSDYARVAKAALDRRRRAMAVQGKGL